jgi:ankyrin repeat protein
MTPPNLQQLEHAILYGDRRLVSWMLDTHPDLSKARFLDNLDLTPLMWACRNRRESIVAELLGRGADPTLRNRLEQNGDGNNTALWFTGQGPMAGTTGIAQRLITAGARVNDICEHGQTALYIAAAWCHLDLVQLLIDSGADASIPNTSGQTPLAMLHANLQHLAGQSSLSQDQRRFTQRAPRVIAFLESTAV